MASSTFRRELLNHRLNPHLLLILYHPAPTAILIQQIAKFSPPNSREIQVIWLTTDNTVDGIRPEQENLVAAIWSAIDRFAET